MIKSDGEDPDASSPASSALSDLEDEGAIAVPGHRPIKRGNGWLWSQEESEIVHRLVEEQGTDVDWERVARDLAAEYPLSGAPTRGARVCASHINNCSESE